MDPAPCFVTDCLRTAILLQCLWGGSLPAEGSGRSLSEEGPLPGSVSLCMACFLAWWHRTWKIFPFDNSSQLYPVLCPGVGFKLARNRPWLHACQLTTRSRRMCENKWESFQIDEISLDNVFKVIKDETFNYIKVVIQIPLNAEDRMGFTRKPMTSNGKMHMKLFVRNSQINPLFGLKDQCNWKERNTVPDPDSDSYQCLISDKDKHTYALKQRASSTNVTGRLEFHM